MGNQPGLGDAKPLLRAMLTQAILMLELPSGNKYIIITTWGMHPVLIIKSLKQDPKKRSLHFDEFKHMKKKNEKIRARRLFNEYASNLYNKDFGKLNTHQKGRALIRWYLTKVAEGREAPSISEDDIDADITDGSSDLGTDYVVKDNGTVYLYQFKFYKDDSQGPDVEDIEHFRNVINRLKSDKFNANSKVKNKICEIDFEDDNFVLRFIALGKTTSTVKAAIDSASEKREDDPRGGLTFEYQDIESLTEELRSSSSEHSISNIKATIFSAGDRSKRVPIIDLSDNKLRSMVMVVDAMQIKKIWEPYKERLFEKNIRNTLKSETNYVIIETAKNKPENFFYFNNGISCLATKIQKHEDHIIANGFQIINGAQTVKALVEITSRSKPDILPKILMRITEISDDTSESDDLRNDITRYNNTQNKITSADFRSNDQIQRELIKEFGKQRRNGRQVLYISKRGERPANTLEIIKMEEFTKVIYAFLEAPLNAQMRSEALFNNSLRGNYSIVFGDGEKVFSSFTEIEFRFRSAVWWLQREFTKQCKIDKDKSDDPNLKAALQRKWALIFTARQVIEKSFGADKYREIMSKYWQGEWLLGVDHVGKEFKKIYDICLNTLQVAYKQYSEDEGGGDSRAWLGRAKTYDQISRDVDRVKPFLKFTL